MNNSSHAGEKPYKCWELCASTAKEITSNYISETITLLAETNYLITELLKLSQVSRL